MRDADPEPETVVNHRLSAREPFDDAWHHIAVVDDNQTVTVYIDGVEDATDFSYTKAPLTANITTIGGILRATPSYWWTGRIDDVRIYNYVLDPAEIAALVTTPPECPAEELQLPGDYNQDGDRNISDVLSYILGSFAHFFLIGPEAVPDLPCPGDAASEGNLAVLDVNRDGVINYVDGVHMANYLYRGGSPPAQAPGCFSIPVSYGCGPSAACPE